MRIPVIVMMCTPPAMIPSRSGFTFGHMGGIISLSPPAAILMPAMDLYLRKVIHPQAHDNYPVLLKDDGLELEIGSIRHPSTAAALSSIGPRAFWPPSTGAADSKVSGEPEPLW